MDLCWWYQKIKSTYIKVNDKIMNLASNNINIEEDSCVRRGAINTVLRPLRHYYALVYLDGILIMSKDMDLAL